MNSSIKSSSILVVNGTSDSVRNTADTKLANYANVVIRQPEEITQSDVFDSDLVLIDHRLTNEQEQNALSYIPTVPKTGISLAAVLREYADESDDPRHITAFCLHTELIDQMRRGLPSATAQHVIASRSNLEWVFPTDEPRRFEQMIILAQAIRELQFDWPKTNVESSEKLKSVLGLKDENSWTDRCWREVRDYLPPVVEMSAGRFQIQVVRWLLHQVMPYCSFLGDEYWAAARLQITVQEFRRVTKGGSQLAEDLDSMRYSGLLSGFLGERWWRGAMEDYVCNLTRPPHYRGQIPDGASKRAGETLERVERDHGLLGLDQNLQPKQIFASIKNTVQLQLDYWPALAEPPWIEVEDVKKSPALMAIVDPLDVDRIETED